MATTTSAAPVRGDNLAFIFQEVITVIERLRAGRLEFKGVDVFRSQVRAALEKAERDGLRRGYSKEDVRVGIFAVVAFLDESILNSRNPVFSDWQRKPLQEELFGVHEAGEIFFRNLDRLLGYSDSEALGDLLEVHQLILALGLRGRYSAGGTAGEIRVLLQNIEEKIRRIRGAAPVAPLWLPPPEMTAPAQDPWLPVMRWIAIGCCVVGLIAFVCFKFSLSSAIAELGSLASQIFS